MIFDKLGPCCVCESETRVHTIIMLDLVAPIRGHGWSCLVCGVPADGADLSKHPEIVT